MTESEGWKREYRLALEDAGGVHVFERSHETAEEVETLVEEMNLGHDRYFVVSRVIGPWEAVVAGASGKQA